MTAPNEKPRVVIVEDHLLLREHLKRMINKQPDMTVSGEADNIQQALEIIQETKPQLALVDLGLYSENGLDLVKSLRSLSIPVSVLVLTMHDEAIRAERAFRAGVQGYVTKHQPSRVILGAMRQVLSGKMYLSENMIDTVLKQLAPGGPKNIKYQSIDRLSNRELAILELIGYGRSSSAIAETLSITMATLATYRRRIKKKVDIHSHSELQHFAIQWLSERG